MKRLLAMMMIMTVSHFISAQDEKAKKELEDLSQEWMDAWKTKDTSKLEQILAPEFRLLAVINGELTTMQRDVWLKTAKVYIPTSVRYYDFDIRIYGHTAIVQSMVEQVATLNGQDRSGTFQVTDVWVKNNDRWRVVHRHTNLKPKTN